MMFTDAQGQLLISLARASIAGKFHPTDELPDADFLRQPGASFVTLTKHGQLRGCIGSLEAWRKLGDDVRSNARSAAFSDPRFYPVSEDELADIRIEVSVLTAPAALEFAGQSDALAKLRPGTDGVILRAGGRRATFLPQVWEELPSPGEFMAQLKRKAGLPADYWSDDVELEIYQVQAFSERS
ncbi:MAG: AmmeMemoRadiSam system protein A [Propionibacteriaceae bacterium]|jgi:AmmeMemoRadiSam system protein A|nr:AmmeMemoRadiSam system protein A [Propionibacteriaceae bacterium]